MKTKGEQKTLQTERQTRVKHTLAKEKARKDTKRDSDERFCYYGYLCDQEICFECGV
ncbi:MAG: hypothetical protein A4E69_02011 [Syntrophus sp. PtaB.Bin138]|jgi:hypothetical protein|nr:MAG: hypothetical protein A4E69_02011 [Syntrophus sp. PtaB.Bin138]